jgi:hypothetical protein
MKYPLDNSETYNMILEHRRICPLWGKSFCLDCFGGGLNKFIEKLKNEKFKFK